MEFPKCSHGCVIGMDRCESCSLERARSVIEPARRVIECFTGSGPAMVLALSGRLLEDRIESLREAFAKYDDAWAYAGDRPTAAGDRT